MGWGWLKIAAGVGLIVASIFIPPAGAFGVELLSTTLVASLGASLTLGGIVETLRKPLSGSLLNDANGRLKTIRQSASPQRVIYGDTRVGGILTFGHASGLRVAPTDQNQLIITLSGHAIDTIYRLQFDDEFPDIDMTTGLGAGPYRNKLFYQSKLGYDGDLSLATYMTGITPWTTSHRQRGCAAAYVRVNFDEKLFPGGIPNITFHVRGKLVFDPRTDSPLTVESVQGTSPESDVIIKATAHGFVGGESIRLLGVSGVAGTWGIDYIDADYFSLQGSAGATVSYTSGGQIFKLAYSNNAALVIADYLIDPWIGLGVPYASVRENVLIAAANVCDEDVEIVASPYQSEKRYTINGTFETSEKPGEILTQMANAMAGHVTNVGGEWHIIPGAYRLPVMELTDADVVGPMQVQSKRSKRDLVNGIKGTFPSEAHGWIETDFPAVLGETYLAADGGTRAWKDVFLPFTTTATAAQRIARIDLERNRRQVSMSLICTMRAYELQPGDVLEFTHSRYGWALETFEVAECGLEQKDGALVISLQLVQTEVDVYGFAVDEYGNLIDPDLLDLLNRKIPFGWSPAMVSRPQSDVLTMRERTDYGFGLTQQYQLNAAGQIVPQIRIAGFVPQNIFSQVISRARTKTLAATTADTGGFIVGGQRYYIGVVAEEAQFPGSPPEYSLVRVTALSEVAVVDIPEVSPAVNTNTVTITDLRWHTSTTAWHIVFGTDKYRLSTQPGAFGYSGFTGAQVSITGPEAQPTSITFKGFNTPSLTPNGYFEHLRGAPDQRFHRLRLKAYRAISLGIWGGQVVSVQAVDSPPTQWSVTLGVDPDFPWTTNGLAGRFISLVGAKDLPLEFITDGGMPLADFLIESNTADTVTLTSGQQNPADYGFVPGAVVVVRTKATEVGVDAEGRNYIADTGFGEGGQELGDADPNIGGGADSLIGFVLRIIAGTGAGTKALISGNTGDASPASDLDRIYIEGEWEVTPDDTSVFIITDLFPFLQHDTDPIVAEKEDTFVNLKVDFPSNLAGDQYLIYAIAVNAEGVEADENSSPYREIYLFGKADEGREVTTETYLTLLDRYVRGNTTAGGFTIHALDPSTMPGIEVVIENSGTGANTLTVDVVGGSLIGGDASITLADGETVLLRARDDLP
jgi:hypothetical protein